MPERYTLTIPLLVVLYVFLGIASAGVNLTVETIGLKLAPEGQSTPYLVGASLSTSIGAALGPLVGGRFADFFSVGQLSFNINWADPSQTIELPAIHLTGHDFLFGIAFLIGLLTINSLNALREEGEVGRDVVLEDLRTQTQEMSRSASSLPGLGFAFNVPYNVLRNVPTLPVPGMDVALSVAAYQLASSVNSAVTAATRGRELATDVAERVGQTVSGTVEQVGDITGQGTELARQATRGAMNATGNVTLNLGQLTKGAVLGTLEALGKTAANPLDALRGVGYGAVQGAGEAGADLRQVAAQAAQGAIEADEAIRPEAAAQVREVILNELLSTAAHRTGEEGIEEDSPQRKDT